ncbi:MAG: hypothetical protein AVDCRST_MAG03-3723 [uncultured Rubrobacteraceae bacterium]|uniref:Uncharacterized protein n=1 Tax=uncultured Rubrobacteraceae bacterium TaxID=349277 RepID=A0A6J4Q893_9ACTN|nr:MAG: hypothetical protein AVDCRST_MAG03-3723 [uncultured Rubrobacteraceae bacterium]
MGRRIEASAVVPMGQEETWDLLEGDQMRRAVELSDAIVAIEDYHMRPDGTPRYIHVGKMGPGKIRFTADYSVFERPQRIEATILDSPFGGAYRVDYEEIPDGTRVTHRWDVEPQNAFFGLLLPAVRPLIERSLRRDLETIARRAPGLSTAPSQEKAGPT